MRLLGMDLKAIAWGLKSLRERHSALVFWSDVLESLLPVQPSRLVQYPGVDQGDIRQIVPCSKV
jgi:hypothetical protein